MRRTPQLKVFHITELDRIMALSEAIRRLLSYGYGNPRLRGCERILDPDSGEPVWRITFHAYRRRKQSPKQT